MNRLIKVQRCRQVFKSEWADSNTVQENEKKKFNIGNESLLIHKLEIYYALKKSLIDSTYSSFFFFT